MADDTAIPDQPLRIAQTGAVLQVVLERPRALNALNHDMKTVLADTLPKFARNPDIYIVVYRATQLRAFCAGGDIRELTGLAERDIAAAKETLATEYAMNWMMDCYPKPSVALMDGATMGSGVGISQYCTHRVAAAGYAFAMPETAVGFFPDVGMAHILARMPDAVGIYLALTGRTIGRADAYHLGLVTHCIEAQMFDAVVTALADAQPVDPLLDERHADPGEAGLAVHRPCIASCFTRESVAEIFAALERARDGHHDPDWIDGVLADLARRSPTSLKVTHAYLRQSARRNLRENLIADYHLACRFLTLPDFREGVRAVLIDKDGKPQWKPACLEDLPDGDVAAILASVDARDFELPPADYLVVGRP